MLRWYDISGYKIEKIKIQVIMKETKEEALKFIENGGKAVYRYGFAFKGARARTISKEDALEKLSKRGWSFGKGFYNLNWLTIDGETCLEFNELGENDMW